MTPMTLPAPQLEHLCDLVVTVLPAIDIGLTSAGRRRVIPITGGVVRGPKMNGKVLNAGADFQLVHKGGAEAHLDARYVLELDDGAHVLVQNTALRVTSAENAQRLLQGQPVNPDEVYFRCQPQLDSAAPQWAWLSDSQFIGTARRAPEGVNLSFYRVL